jgi:hypothetical protein
LPEARRHAQLELTGPGSARTVRARASPEPQTRTRFGSLASRPGPGPLGSSRTVLGFPHWLAAVATSESKSREQVSRSIQNSWSDSDARSVRPGRTLIKLRDAGPLRSQATYHGPGRRRSRRRPSQLLARHKRLKAPVDRCADDVMQRRITGRLLTANVTVTVLRLQCCQCGVSAAACRLAGLGPPAGQSRSLRVRLGLAQLRTPCRPGIAGARDRPISIIEHLSCHRHDSGTADLVFQCH